MDEIRGLRSANAKLQSDKKALEKRVSDLEEEIKTRCRNYMTIIEKLKRGEGVQVSHIIDRSADKEFMTPKRAEPLKKPFSFVRLYTMKVEGEAEQKDNGNSMQEHQSPPSKAVPTKLRTFRIHTLPSYNLHIVKPFKRQILQTLVSVSIIPQNSRQKRTVEQACQTPIELQPAYIEKPVQQSVNPRVEDQSTQTITFELEVPHLSVPSISSLGHDEHATEQANHRDHIPTAWQPGPRWSIPFISRPPSQPRIPLTPQQQLLKIIDEHNTTIRNLRARLSELEKQVTSLIKYKALCNQLLNYKPPSVDQLKKQIEKKMSNPSTKLGQAASALESHVNSLLRKLQYYETIIYGVEGYPEKSKAKFNEKPLAKLLEDMFRQIVVQDSQKRDAQENQEHYEHDLNGLQEELRVVIQQRNELIEERRVLLEASRHQEARVVDNPPSSNQSTPIKQLTMPEAPVTATTATNTQNQQAETASLQASSASSKKSEGRKKLSVEMARHHMIMFNKEDACKECRETKLFMNARIDELMNSKSRELAELVNQHRQECNSKDMHLAELTQEVQNLRRQLSILEEQIKNAPRVPPQEVEPCPLDRVGYEFKELPFEQNEFVKRSYLKTTRMKRTTSNNKVYTKSLNRQEIRQHLFNKLHDVTDKLEELRSSNKQQSEEAVALENLKKKLSRVYRKYDDDGEQQPRESDRSSESSQCQQSSTEIIEVRLETPSSTTEDLKLVTSRMYFPSEERIGQFDFRKKDRYQNS